MLEHGTAPQEIPAESTFNCVWWAEHFPKQLGKKYNCLGDCSICVLLIHIRKQPNKTAAELQLLIEQEVEHTKLHKCAKKKKK